MQECIFSSQAMLLFIHHITFYARTIVPFFRLLFRSHRHPHLELLNHTAGNKVYVVSGSIELKIACNDLVLLTVNKTRVRIISNRQEVGLILPVKPTDTHVVLTGIGVFERFEYEIPLVQEAPDLHVRPIKKLALEPSKKSFETGVRPIQLQRKKKEEIPAFLAVPSVVSFQLDRKKMTERPVLREYRTAISTKELTTELYEKSKHNYEE